jgi:hypothetical protein
MEGAFMRSILLVAGAAILLAGLPSAGFAEEQNPTVGDFIARCSTVEHVPRQPDSDAYVNCTNEMMAAELDPGYCPPPKDTSLDEPRVAAIDWLKQRPAMSSMDETAGLVVALKALYCH